MMRLITDDDDDDDDDDNNEDDDNDVDDNDDGDDDADEADDTNQSVNDAWQLGLNEEITGGLKIMINGDHEVLFHLNARYELANILAVRMRMVDY